MSDVDFGRKTAAAELERKVAELDRRVAERTAELQVAVSNLHAQISQRAQAEARLRDSEQRYRRLIELSPDAVLVITETDVLYVNAAAVRLFGATDAAALLATAPASLVHAAEPAQAAARLSQLLADGNVTPQIEAPLLRLDGTPIDAEVTSARVNFDGQPAAQLLVRNVGERRAVERMKDELLSIVSHELRTPLTSLRGSLGLLAGGFPGLLPPPGQRMLEIAISNADRLIRVLNDVLDLERLRAGRVLVDPRPHLASDLVDQTVRQTRDAAEHAGVQLLVEDVDGCVSADAERVVQVLTNLASNAIKFTPPAGRVGLSARRQGQYVLFSVSDTGPGIPADQLEAIFERFRQVDASDARRAGGAGLGLAICRGIVQQHHGRLWAESTLGNGSTFYVELPSAS